MRPQTHRGEKRVTLTPLHLFDVVVVWWSWIDRLAGINAQMTLKRYSADVQWSKNKGKMQFGEVALIINHKFDKKYLINSKIKISWNWLIHIRSQNWIGSNQLLIVALSFLFLEPCVLQMLDDAAWVFPNLSIEFNENMVEYEYILAC